MPRIFKCAKCGAQYIEGTVHQCEGRAKHAAWKRAWRAAHASPERRAAHAAEMRALYWSDPSVKEAMNAYAKRYAAEHPEAIRDGVRRWRARHPEKVAAHLAVQRAVRRGELMKAPCWCGEPRVYAHHHNGYAEDHVLDIVWLCGAHHRQAHRKP